MTDNNEIVKMPFFKSFYETLKGLPPEVVKEALCAICAYAFDGEDPEGLSILAEVFFKMAVPNIDSNMAISRKRAEARTKGTKESFDKSKNADDNFDLSKNTSENFDKSKNADENFVKSNENYVPLGKGKGEGKGSRDRDIGSRDRASGNGSGSRDRETGSGSVDSTRAHEPLYRPTVEDVEGYARRNGLEINAKAFVAHYNSIEWQIRGQPILDWRSRVNLWAMQDAEKKANAPPKSAYMAAIENRVSDIDGWVERRSAEDEPG